MSARCDSCHRRTPPGVQRCKKCRGELENHDLEDYIDT